MCFSPSIYPVKFWKTNATEAILRPRAQKRQGNKILGHDAAATAEGYYQIDMEKAMSKIVTIIKAVQAGQELRTPDKWKKGHVLTNLTGAVVAGIITALHWWYPDVPLPDGVAEYAAEMIGTALVLVNLYLTYATSTKIGVKKQ